MTLARRSRWATLLLWIVLAQGGASAQSSTEAPLLRPGTLAEIEERGSGSETLVLVPCMSCRWTSWEPFMARNADRWRMFAVTLPGFGGAPLPDLPLDGDEAVWQTNAVEAIGRLLVDRDLRNVTLVGHSFGASIALQAAGRYADRVTRLVNVDGPLTSPRQWFKPTGDQRVTAARQVVARNLPVLWEPDYWRSFNTPAITDPVRQRLYHGMFMATPRHVLLQYWRENHLRDLNPIVAGLRVPVLDLKMIGASTADPEAVRAAHLAGLAEANAPSTLRTVFFYDTGHYVQEERPESLESAIEKFFRGGRIDDLRPEPRVTVAAPAAFGHVERAGTGPVPMILMPCLGCDWRAFDEFMARNGSRYRMFAVTWPGMGDTPLPRVAPSRDGTPLWDNLIAATARLIKEEQLEHPVLVGHSATGPLVVRFAVEHPDLVGKVITLDATIANDATRGPTPRWRPCSGTTTRTRRGASSTLLRRELRVASCTDRCG